MKKVILVVLGLFGTAVMVNAQNGNSGQTSEGSWFLEVNTGSFSTGNTSFSLTSSDGNTSWSAGIDGGYFVTENLAVKAGIGYNDPGDFSDGILVYKVGGKYYLNGQIPLGMDFTGLSFDGNGANWIGFQGGYAVFLGDMVALEPGLRYNLTLDEADADSIFQAFVGFTIFL
ncbi:hypothetical protein [Allomuricauda sp. SCSIO 65647]|uniref:hypothetical protein n=1 Tax=Allomuricauda sp. SCSIO 65647 TaxID=2908843 RepID=UPI001F3CA709|nr:hypothetical protein [Muricauda sp. SCSIO 65647]UJH66902.1 hypothetical protein L0P89_13170 [Muricauda sp. SCSIO 65647]